MMNIYNGNIITDQNGLAVVELPDYFESLNRDFRYQLTVAGVARFGRTDNPPSNEDVAFAQRNSYSVRSTV
jgi:hypothetical protein